jgi:dUTP pyrophosphatase
MDVVIGGVYRHYKGNEYRVLEVARNCDNPNQSLVIYRANYNSFEFGDGQVWVRLLDEFTGLVEVGGERVERFKLISDASVNVWDRVKVRVKRLKSNAIVPSYAHSGDAAMDLYSAEDCVISAGERKIVSTGIAMEFSSGYWANIRGKSGLAAKRGISILGGVIEYTYRGEYGVIVLNTSKEDFIVKSGDKIAQVIFAPVSTAEVEEVDELSETSRGFGAWGSTGGSNV